MDEPIFTITSGKPYTGEGTFTIENGEGHKDKFFASLHFITESFLTQAHLDREPINKYTTTIERRAIIEGDDLVTPEDANISAYKIILNKYHALVAFE